MLAAALEDGGPNGDMRAWSAVLGRSGMVAIDSDSGAHLAARLMCPRWNRRRGVVTAWLWIPPGLTNEFVAAWLTHRAALADQLGVREVGIDRVHADDRMKVVFAL